MKSFAILSTELQDIVTQIFQRELSPKLQGVLLTGSFVRGDELPFSDVDIVLFYETDEFTHQYNLEYIVDRLISITKYSIAYVKQEILNINSKIWTKNGYQNSLVLYDPNGGLEEIITLATNHPWEYNNRIDYINLHYRGIVEEIHKILNGLLVKDTSMLLNAIYSINITICNIICYYYEIEILSENYFYDQIQVTLSESKQQRWLQAWQGLNGLNGETMILRGRYAIILFLETFQIITDVLTDDSQEFLMNTLTLIERVKNNLGHRF